MLLVMTILIVQRPQEIVFVVFHATPFHECVEASFGNFYYLVDKHLSFAGIFNIILRFRGMDGS